jgi:hypothetical protein
MMYQQHLYTAALHILILSPFHYSSVASSYLCADFHGSKGVFAVSSKDFARDDRPQNQGTHLLKTTMAN